MAGVQLLDFDSHDETRAPGKTRVDVVRMGEATAARFAVEPGCAAAIAATRDHAAFAGRRRVGSVRLRCTTA